MVRTVCTKEKTPTMVAVSVGPDLFQATWLMDQEVAALQRNQSRWRSPSCAQPAQGVTVQTWKDQRPIRCCNPLVILCWFCAKYSLCVSWQALGMQGSCCFVVGKFGCMFWWLNCLMLIRSLVLRKMECCVFLGQVLFMLRSCCSMSLSFLAVDCPSHSSLHALRVI